jgi:hypothetical protein
MTDMTIKTPWHLWFVGVIAVLFNAIGAFDYVMSMAQGESYMASAGMTPAQIRHYREMPMWMIAVWTIGVWSAIIGSVLIPGAEHQYVRVAVRGVHRSQHDRPRANRR